MVLNATKLRTGDGWYKLNKIGRLYYKQNNFVAMDLNEAETNFWPTVCLNTKLM